MKICAYFVPRGTKIFRGGSNFFEGGTKFSGEDLFFEGWGGNIKKNLWFYVIAFEIIVLNTKED